jgi:hypothetical protein
LFLLAKLICQSRLCNCLAQVAHGDPPLPTEEINCSAAIEGIEDEFEARVLLVEIETSYVPVVIGAQCIAAK